MTDDEETNLLHTVAKCDEDLTNLTERVARLDAALKAKSDELAELKKNAESELRRHWSSIMHLVVAFETLESWLKTNNKDSSSEFQRFRDALDTIKKTFAG